MDFASATLRAAIKRIESGARKSGGNAAQSKPMSSKTAIDEPEIELRARLQSDCFVCGQNNPRGLRLQFQPSEGGEANATWTPGPAWEGFRGIVHGGVVSTVLDEAMSKAVVGSGAEALTGELRVRFRRPVASGGTFLIRGWVVNRRKRLIETEGSVTALDGTEHAHAWARFFTLVEARP